jgi:predicted metal-dependent phosphoesterase TrpH
MRCDLHIHSRYSDGTKTPAELVDIAIANNVGAIALTDHNTVDGLEEFMEYASNKNIDAIPGVEISTEYNGIELHIVGLFISRFHLNSIRKYLSGISKRKEESNIKLVTELAKLGYEIDYEKLRAEHTGSINRAVIAAEMMRKGYINSIKEAHIKWHYTNDNILVYQKNDLLCIINNNNQSKEINIENINGSYIDLFNNKKVVLNTNISLDKYQYYLLKEENN